MQTNINTILSLVLFFVNLTFVLGGRLNLSQREVKSANCVFNNVPVPLYHVYDVQYKDHIYTTSVSEMEDEMKLPIFEGEGVVGSMFANEEMGMVALYRLYNANMVDHFYTSDQSEENWVQQSGYQLQEVVGYVLPEAACGAMAFYRFKHEQTGKHFYTLSENEFQAAAAQGYRYEGVIGYILPSYTPTLGDS